MESAQVHQHGEFDTILDVKREREIYIYIERERGEIYEVMKVER